MATTWSDKLVEETRNALENCLVTLEGLLHMKNSDGAYGSMRLENLVANCWLIEDKESDAEYLFGSVDELIAAGWAID